jgi:protein-S-isoprenylcysteine O-methyltransferase Ste14
MSSLFYFFWFIEFRDVSVAPLDGSPFVTNVLVFLIFPMQHSLLPRRFIKDRIHPYFQRPFYVLTSGVALWIVLLLWQPFGPVLYQDLFPWLFDILFYASLALIVVSTIALTHGQMFGLYQGYAAWKGLPLPVSKLRTCGIYGVVRHPITSLLIVALWSHESLTLSRALFNALFTGYALIGTFLEERSLQKEMGQTYLDYKERVPAFIPFLR